MTYLTFAKIVGLNGAKRAVDLKFNRDVNILFGANGAGKTSILKIINSALLDDVTKIEDTVFSSASVGMMSSRYKREFILKFNSDEQKDGRQNPELDAIPQVRVGGQKTTKSWNLSPKIEDRDDRTGIWWQHTYLPTSRLYTTGPRNAPSYLPWEMERVNVSSLSEDGLNKRFAEATQDVWRDFDATTSRVVRNTQEQGLRDILAEVLSSRSIRKKTELSTPRLEAGEAFDRMNSFLQKQTNPGRKSRVMNSVEFSQRYPVEVQLQNTVEIIDRVERKVLDQTKQLRDLSSLIRKLFGGEKKISFDGPRILVLSEDGKSIGLEHLSSGEKQAITLFLAAIGAEDNTLIIDEPEISMHIDWQRDLIKNIHILSPDCQLLLATHSPEIMAEVPDSRIFKI